MYVTDYHGSVRAVVDGRTGELYKAVDYSSYGEETIVEAASVSGGITLQDGYTGKKDQHPDFGTSYTAFGARQYHPQLHRWMTPDPLAEKYYDVSPYAFCDNEPVNRFDPNGKWDIKVSAMNDRGNYPYAMLTVMKRGGETIYKTVVKVRGNHRNRSQTNGDTPIGEYKIDEWRQTGTRRYPADAYGPNELLALIYLGKEGTGRSGIHLHGGRNQMELSNTLGCIRIADEDIAELKILTEALEASDPEEKKECYLLKMI